MRDYKKNFNELNDDRIRRIKIIDRIAFILIVIILPIAFVYHIMTNVIGVHPDLVLSSIITGAFLVFMLRLIYHGLRVMYCKRLNNLATLFVSGYVIDVVDALRSSYFPQLSKEFVEQLRTLMYKKQWLNYKTFEFDATGMDFDYKHDEDAVLLLELQGWHHYLTGWTYAAHLDGFIFTFDKRPMGGNGPIEQVTYYIHRAE